MPALVALFCLMLLLIRAHVQLVFTRAKFTAFGVALSLHSCVCMVRLVKSQQTIGLAWVHMSLPCVLEMFKVQLTWAAGSTIALFVRGMLQMSRSIPDSYRGFLEGTMRQTSDCRCTIKEVPDGRTTFSRGFTDLPCTDAIASQCRAIWLSYESIPH